MHITQARVPAGATRVILPPYTSTDLGPFPCPAPTHSYTKLNNSGEAGELLISGLCSCSSVSGCCFPALQTTHLCQENLWLDLSSKVRSSSGEILPLLCTPPAWTWPGHGGSKLWPQGGNFFSCTGAARSLQTLPVLGNIFFSPKEGELPSLPQAL